MAEQIGSESVRDTFDRVERRAVIDVGTNSVKLLVADAGRVLKPVLKLTLQTALGQGSFRTGRLQPEAIARTVDAVAGFAAEAAALGSVSIRVLATSVVRETANRHELIQAIESATRLSVTVLSGEQEADYVFQGVTNDPLVGTHPVLIVDVGGGSTEWAVGESGFIYFRKSTPLGTARLLELHPPGDAPSRQALTRLRATVSQFIQAEVTPSLGPVLRSFCGRPVRLVGLGGGLATLARLGPAPAGALSGKPQLLGREHLVQQVERLWHLPLQERRLLPGLEPQRAEVILAGAVIHEAVLNQFDFNEILVSQHGLREGFLLFGPRQSGAAVGPALPQPSCASPVEMAPGGWTAQGEREHPTSNTRRSTSKGQHR